MFQEAIQDCKELTKSLGEKHSSSHLQEMGVGCSVIRQYVLYIYMYICTCCWHNLINPTGKVLPDLEHTGKENVLTVTVQWAVFVYPIYFCDQRKYEVGKNSVDLCVAFNPIPYTVATLFHDAVIFVYEHLWHTLILELVCNCAKLFWARLNKLAEFRHLEKRSSMGGPWVLHWYICYCIFGNSY